MGLTNILLFLIISFYVARSSSQGNTLSQAEILQFSDLLGIWASPFIFSMLAFFASLWLALKVRTQPQLHGLVIGLRESGAGRSTCSSTAESTAM